MRTLKRALLALSLALLCGSAAWAQNNQNKENTSASAGGAYDPSPCNDPRIATNEAAQKATAYCDATPTGEPDPLAAALYDLAQQYDNGDIDKASECLHASGVVFMVPDNLVGQVTMLVGEIEASEPGGASGNTSANEGSPGQSGGVAGGTVPVSGGTSSGGGPTASGSVTASGTPCEPNYDMSTTAGRAAAMQDAAQTQYACCIYRRAHNPELAACTPPPEAKQVPPPAAKTTRNPPLVASIQWTAGFVNGAGDCAQSMVNLVGAAAWVATGIWDPVPGDEFLHAAHLLGLQSGQSLNLRQIEMEFGTQVAGENSNPFDAGSAGGRRACLYGLIPGVIRAAKTVGVTNGAKVGNLPATTTPGASPSTPLGGAALLGSVSTAATAAKLPGAWVPTPGGAVQLGNFVGKGTFGAVFQLGASEVIKVGTNDPLSSQSFVNQVAGSKLLNKATVATANIVKSYPGTSTQPSMLIMNNVFKTPGAFQVTSKGFKITLNTINGGGTGGAPLTKLTAAEAAEVAAAQQVLNDKIIKAGLIFADNNPGNVIYTPNGDGSLTAVVVDTDFVVTLKQFQKLAGRKTGLQFLQDVVDKKPIPNIIEVMVSVLFQGGGIDALGPGSTPQVLMDALTEARQNIADAIQAAEAASPAGGNAPAPSKPGTPTAPRKPN